MTPTDITSLLARVPELRAKAEKRTPGTWRVERPTPLSHLVSIETDEDYVADCNALIGNPQDTYNAAYIVAACNVLPKLLSALTAQGEIIREAREVVHGLLKLGVVSDDPGIAFLAKTKSYEKTEGGNAG